MSSWNFVVISQFLFVASFGSHLTHPKSFLSLSEKIAFNASLTCTIVQNGTFLKDPAACDKWIQCVDKKPISGSCTDGLFYNKDTNKCVNPKTIKCYSSDPCAAVTSDGTFVDDPYSCNNYYYCSNGTATLGVCSPGLNYNSVSQVCIQNYVCPLKPSPDNWCNIIPDGQFFADLHSCRQYHFCRNGVLENGTCSAGYYFNAFKSICDYEKDVECNHPGEHEVILSGRGICQVAGQFLSDNRTCSGYFYCQEEAKNDFQMVWNKCSNGMFFDPSNGGECGNRIQILCKYDRCEGMGLKNIQLISSQADGCKGYSICQDGKTIGTGKCPNDEEYFDEVLQRCTKSIVEYPICLNSTTSASLVKKA